MSYPTFPAPPPNYPQPTSPPTNKLAVVSLILGILALMFSWCTFGIFSIAGIITGHIALKQIKRTRESGRGLAVAALWLSYITLAFALLITITAIILTASGEINWNTEMNPDSRIIEEEN